MTVAYWIIAALLALLYLYSGGLKVPAVPRSAAADDGLDRHRCRCGWCEPSGCWRYLERSG